MRIALTAAALAASTPAIAQSGPTVGAEVATQEVRRGLGWSGGRAAVSADATVPLGPLAATARVATLRGSPRHLGADAVADLGLEASFPAGPLTARLRATSHLFADAANRADYHEVGTGLGYLIGPVQLDADLVWAPRQRAIGGDNLYAALSASAGLPGTPVTLSGGVGHSSGGRRSVLADRLRPGGAYADWRLGAEYVFGRASVIVEYAGTDVSGRRGLSPVGDPTHAGDRIVARLRWSY